MAKAPDLSHLRRTDDGHAFLPDPSEDGRMTAPDDLAETLGEDFIASATSAEEQGEDARNQVYPEELGGPFVETSSEEFADGVDGANPEEAMREPFPTAVRVQK